MKASKLGLKSGENKTQHNTAQHRSIAEQSSAHEGLKVGPAQAVK
jgi:hypothetical protein